MPKKKQSAEAGKNNLQQQALGKILMTGETLTPLEMLSLKCLDPLDVVAILKISLNTLSNWYKKGWLPISFIGKRRYIDYEDFLAMLEKNKRCGAR